MEASHRRELATQGWTVLRAHLPTGLTSRLRAVVDSVLGGPAPVRCVAERGIAVSPDVGSWGQSAWDYAERCVAEGHPVIDSAEWRHDIRHPLPHPELALAVTEGGLPELLADLLHSELSRLRLMQQILVRTDPCGEPERDRQAGTPGWHLVRPPFPVLAPAKRRALPSRLRPDAHAHPAPQDTTFLPRHYEARPRQNLYHCLSALHDIDPLCAPFLLVPGSHEWCRAYTAALPPERLAALRDEDFRTLLREEMMAKVDVSSGGVEMLLREGDSKDHAPSPPAWPCILVALTRRFAQPRSACVRHDADAQRDECEGGSGEARALLDVLRRLVRLAASPWSCVAPAKSVLRSASYALLPPRPSSASPTKFLAEFRAALPPGKRGLLDWAAPPAPRL